MRFWREAAGTCALMGAGLPADEALMAHAHVEQRAQAYRQAGVKRPIDILRVAAYLDLLNLVPAADRVARFRAEDQAGAAGESGDASCAGLRATAKRAAARAGRNHPGPGGSGDPGRRRRPGDATPTPPGDGGARGGGDLGGPPPDEYPWDCPPGDHFPPGDDFPAEGYCPPGDHVPPDDCSPPEDYCPPEEPACADCGLGRLPVRRPGRRRQR